jgi:phenylalanyl-tRNA synthetase alpha chain
MALITDKIAQEIIIESTKEKELTAGLEKHNDPDSLRLKRFLTMPDLSRSPGSPIKELVDLALKTESLLNFDRIKVPEVVSAKISFDLFNFPPDHPARSASDTYYVDSDNVLRTHTTVMWYYYLNQPEVKERIANGEAVGSISYGKVYRKDEIDRRHMNVFHQIDGWYLVPKDQKNIEISDLQDVLSGIAKSIFGPDVSYRFNTDTFPYTEPSIEMEVEIEGQWVELLGAGVVRAEVLSNLGVNPEIYNGWAFGFGLERMAIVSMKLPDIRLLWSSDERVKKQLKLGHKFKEVSKFPPVIRDISFVVANSFVPNNYFDLIRDVGGELVEEVSLLDKFESEEKFGKDRTSYTFRITYRHLEKTLTNAEVNTLHAQIEKRTESDFEATIRLD